MTGPGPSSSPESFDETLLARMTGRLGDRQTVEQIAASLATALCEPLQGALHRLSATPVTATRGRIALGLRSDLERSIDQTSVRCSAAVKGWCQDILIAADAPFAIAFAESLLGGAADSDASATRAPTEIELDVSIVLFEQAVTALSNVVAAADAIATTGQPFVGAEVEADDEGSAAHAVLVTLDMTLDDHSAQMHLLLPQTTVTKSKITAVRPSETAATSRQPEWAEKLKDQVARSDVTLKARIRLAPLTLGSLSRLRPGDVLAFADEKEVEVDLDANGMHIYRCELGRSGDRYTVRLKAAQSLEADLIEYLGG